jgi:hypothetical protein
MSNRAYAEINLLAEGSCLYFGLRSLVTHMDAPSINGHLILLYLL